MAYVADGRVRAAERDRLVHRVAAAYAATLYADGRITATVRYASPQLGGAATPPRVRRSLEGLVESAAADQVAPVAAARATVAQVRVLPWHGALRRARERSTRYLDLRLARLRAGSTDVTPLLTPDPASADARREARAALLAAGAAPDDVQAALGPP